MQETGCLPTASKAKLRFESVGFSAIPGQTKLFLQYQADPASLKKYYPSVVSSHVEIANRRAQVLDAYSVDRESLCDILAAQNDRFGAGPATTANIDLLRRTETIAILTGQQAGLFTGPLYTIYKALSAIKMAACLRERGINAVPIFWAATEDHDFDEISKAFFQADGATPIEFTLSVGEELRGRPIGTIPIPQEFDRELSTKLYDVAPTEFRGEVFASLGRIWKSGRTIGEAFCMDIQRLFREFGLIVVDPIDPRLKKLASPVFSSAASHAGDIVTALVRRSKELEEDGYHAQVFVGTDYYPFFYQTDDGVRRSVRSSGRGAFRVSETDHDLTVDELVRIAETEPERLSPGVMLRPVVQDYLFPTACYFGGGAEIAYFAQNSEVYRILDRPVTPILHRQSFTVIEAKHARTLARYELEFSDLFQGIDNVLPKIVERFVNPTTARIFADAEEKINLELNHLDQELSRVDPTLAGNLATRRRKIVYHLEELRKKFHRSQILRDQVVNRQLLSLFVTLMPDGQLQERTLNVEGFLSKCGPYFIDWVNESIDLEDRGHRLIYL